MTTNSELASTAQQRIASLRPRRDEQDRIIRGIRARVDRDNRDELTADEASRVRAAAARRDEIEDELEDLEQQVATYERQANVAGRFAESRRQEGGGASTYSPARTAAADPYRPDGDASYFLDRFAAKQGDPGARERLDVHRQAITERLRDSNEPMLRAMLRAAEGSDRAVSTGGAGAFLPPIWLLDEYVAIFRPARATVDALHSEPLPQTGMAVYIPKLSAGTAVAAQTAENTVVATNDLTTGTSIQANVNTLAGHLPVSWQARDRAGYTGGFDKIVQQDLLAAYIQSAGSLVLTGTGASGQPLGILNLGGTTAITYTDGTPAFMGAGKLYSKIAQAIQSVQATRFLSPNAIIMHPRRWQWLSVQTDTIGRAVVLPAENGPENAAGIQSTGAAQGKVGRMLGLDVIADPNVPINLGAGTNQDPIVVARTDDSWWFEDGPHINEYDQTLATQLSREIVLYSYVALGHRSPGSIAVINGTGLVTPTW